MRSRLLLVLGLLAAAPAAAQEAAVTAPDASLGRPVEAVGIYSEGRPLTDPALFDLIQVRAGDRLTMDAVRESISHLFSLGRFQDIRVSASPSPAGGLALRVDVVPIHAVTSLQFSGTLGLSSGLLRDTLTDRFGGRPSAARAAEAASVLEALYRDRGYLQATVEAAAEERHDPDRTVLTFTIDSGPRAVIAEAAVIGSPDMTPAGLLRTLHAARGEPYQAPELQRRLDEFVAGLRRRGFYEASASLLPSVSADRRTVNLTVDVTAGPKVVVRYDGDRLPAERLRELVPVEREHSVAEDLLEDSVEAIRRYLQQQGYWHAEVSMRREEVAGTLTVVFDVHRGRRYVLAEPVAFAGNQAVPTADLQSLVALKAGDVFIESNLARIAGAVTELYRQRGFTSAQVSYAVNDVSPPAGEGRVRPVITIAEGAQTLVGAVHLAGTAALAEAEVRPLVRLTAGQPYYAPQAAADREAIALDYLNNGFQSVTVEVEAVFSEDRTRVDLTYRVQEGPQTTVDHILIVGNTNTDPAVILNEMRLKPGAPLGREDLLESQRALSALGLFRRVRITELRHGSGTSQDLLVTVDEAPMTTIGYGGGVEASQRLRSGANGEAVERLEFAPRGFFNIGRRNVGGRNRTLDFYSRVSLSPKDAPDNPEVDGTGFDFSDYRVVTTYRQPRAFADTDVLFTAAIEQGVRSTYSFARRGVNLDLLHRLTQSIRVTGRYSLNSTRTFNERLSEEEQATIDRLFPRVRLSTLSSAVVRDTRDDVLEPRRGTFSSAEFTVAPVVLGSQVGFVKTYVQGSWFRQIGARRPMVLATRGILGLADAFKREISVLDDAGVEIPGRFEIIDDLPASERFFAGGDTTIRGFALDTVGSAETISANGFPRGGNAVIILNAELRFPVWRDIGAVVFADGGNVYGRVSNLDITELRGAGGFGLRYRSPVGPIRLDVGFKMDRREIGGRLEPRVVWHFSIGQAF
jgi:outer membrane protein insertion porin family